MPTAQAGETSAAEDALFPSEMQAQLDAVFARMAQPLLLKLYLDERPISEELEQFITSLSALSDKLGCQVCERNATDFAPCVEICLADGTKTGLAFHGVPSGHEFSSFVLGLYNAAGPGQAMDEATKKKIDAITDPTELEILVTLSCTMCPDLVVASQRIAAANPKVTAHVYDLRHFEDLKQRYKVMSVPCMIVNHQAVHFGKKTLDQVIALLQSPH